MKSYVLMHSDADGFCAGYAVWASNQPWAKEATYLTVNYNQPLPELEPKSRVVIVDFSYSRTIMETLIQTHAEVLCLDHHKTAEAELKGLPNVFFDMTRSGCWLAWEHFHPRAPIPKLVQYVDDRDLWKFENPLTEAFNAYISSYKWIDDHTKKPDWQRWEYFHHLAETDSAWKPEATAILRRERQLVESLISKPSFFTFEDKKYAAVNTSLFQSETGNALLIKYPDIHVAMLFSVDPTTFKCKYSLRSRENEIDVSQIAKQFGGGGHRCAAGFQHDYAFWRPLCKEQG